MVTIYDVPANELIKEIAIEFKAKFQKPEWVDFVKTGSHRERAPQDVDWYYMRLASVLYRVYKDGPTGTEGLRTYYGGRKARGVKPHIFRKASGKVIRCCLQVLEKDGMIKKLKKGRIVSPKGEAYLTKKAKEIYPKVEELAKKDRPIPVLRVAKKDEAAEEFRKQAKGKVKPEDKDKKGKEKPKGKKDGSESRN